MPYANVPKPLWGKMDSCVESVMAKQKVPKKRAIAICYSSLVNQSASRRSKEAEK